MMNKKYNLALLPTTQNDSFIRLAHRFIGVSDQYILGPNSLPHITLRQFYSSPEDIETIWNKAVKVVPQSLDLSLESFSFTTSDDKVFWIALLPDQREQLFDLHKKISTILNLEVKENYFPHLTLCNTQMRNCDDLISAAKKDYVAVTDRFRLSLGDCDDIGQFSKN